MAAAAGLIFSGIATYYTSQQITDQKRQAEDQEKKEKRAQAEQVSFWKGYTGKDEPFIVVNNGSPDVINRVAVMRSTFNGRKEDPKPPPILVATIPSCTRAILSGKAILELDRLYMAAAGASRGEIEAYTESFNFLTLDTLIFADAHGSLWNRDRTGTINRFTDGSTLSRVYKGGPIYLPNKDVRFEPESNCGSS